MNTNTRYAYFYRPLVAQLRNSGLNPVSRRGWRGRWRSFESGYSTDVVYGADALGKGAGKVYVFLQMQGEDRSDIYEALILRRDQIDGVLEGAIWKKSERWHTISLKTEGILRDDYTSDENVRQWMARNLLLLEKVLQPHLDQVMREVRP